MTKTNSSSKRSNGRKAIKRKEAGLVAHSEPTTEDIVARSLASYRTAQLAPSIAWVEHQLATEKNAPNEQRHLWHVTRATLAAELKRRTERQRNALVAIFAEAAKATASVGDGDALDALPNSLEDAEALSLASKRNAQLAKARAAKAAKAKRQGKPAPSSARNVKHPLKVGASRLKVGQVIDREYKGKMYRVEVTADGFKLGRETFRSLSAAADSIVSPFRAKASKGRVSGRVFFGL